jgi:predicted transcriptional regulator of viral defense system
VTARPAAPSWSRLYEIAAAQAGYFTTQQAAEAGYSSPLLHKHIKAGRIHRVRRGILRLVHFPAGDHEELVIIWLWSGHEGVFSHQTALALHELSDSMPAKVHVTLPAAWSRRRLRPPAPVVIHHGDVPAGDRQWLGPVPITSPHRTLVDVAGAHLAPDLLQQAIRQATRRHLVSKQELAALPRHRPPSAGRSA